MKYLFGTFFLIWLASVGFQKLPTIWAYIVAILEFVGDSLTTPASAADDDDDSPGISSIFNDDFHCSTCGNMICTCNDITTCFTCGSSICSCHTGIHDDPFRDDSTSSLFDD